MNSEQKTAQDLDVYNQLGRLIGHTFKTTFTKEDLTTLNLLAEYFRSTKKGELALVFDEVQNYLTTLINTQDEVTLSEQQNNAWRIPFHQYEFKQFITGGDSRSVSDIHGETRFRACLLPSMINNFESMLKWVFEPSMYEKCKTQYREFMPRFLATHTNNIMSGEDVDFLSFFSNRDPEDPIIQELLKFKESGGSIDDLSEDTLNAVQHLFKDMPLPPFDIEIIFNLIDPQLQVLDELQAVYAVDIAPYAKMFSGIRSGRLLQEGSNQDIVELIENRFEEFEKLCEGILNLITKVRDAERASRNFVDMMVLFPLWLWRFGEHYKPLDYLSAFMEFRNEEIKVHGKNYHFHRQHLIDNFKMDYPELMEFLEPLTTSCKQLTAILGSFNSHLLAICLHDEHFKIILQKFKSKALAAKTKQTEEMALFEARQERSLRAQELLLAEEAHRKTIRSSHSKSKLKPIRGKGKARQQLTRQITKSSTIAEPVSNPASSNEIISRTDAITPKVRIEEIGSVGHTLNQFLEAFNAVSMENLFAQRSWQSAVESFKDLIPELIDRPILEDPKQVSEHCNRLIVLSSLLLEQIVSAHFLEKIKPENAYVRWQNLRHGIIRLYEKSELTNVEGLGSLVHDLNNLETFSRSLYTSPRRESRGAQLLYLAEKLRLHGDLELKDLLIRETYKVLKEELNLIGQLLPRMEDLSLDSLDTLLTTSALKRKSTEEQELLHSIDKALAKLPQIEVSVEEPSISNPYCHLADARRLLELMGIRVERGLQGGNVRNYHKIVSTYPPLATESLCLGKTGLKGTRDLTALNRSDLTHNLMDWCEEFGYFNPGPQAKAYLYRSDKVHNFARYSPLYDPTQQNSIARITLEQMAFLNKHITTGVDRTGEQWTLVGRGYDTLRHIIAEERRYAKVGLGIFVRLAS